jgi:hypothetical protein
MNKFRQKEYFSGYDDGYEQGIQNSYIANSNLLKYNN